MATFYAYATENIVSSYKAKWTFAYTYSDNVVIDTTSPVVVGGVTYYKLFTFPKVEAKMVYAGKNYLTCTGAYNYKFGDQWIMGNSNTGVRSFDINAYVPMQSDKYYPLGCTAFDPVRGDFILRDNNSTVYIKDSSLVDYFSPTDSTVPFETRLMSLHLTSSKLNGTMYNGWNYETQTGYGFVLFTTNVTLKAPPDFTVSAMSKDTTEYYAGITNVSVTVSDSLAQYGATVESATLSVTGKTATISGDGTITMQLGDTGITAPTEYLPQVTVTDSRGQTKTKTLATITVYPYVAPSVSAEVYRCDSAGAKSDEGRYAVIDAQINYLSSDTHLVAPTVQTYGTSTTWYSQWTASGGVSSPISNWSSVASGAHVYGLINGNFAEDTSYQITMTASDALGGVSNPVSTTLSTAFYTIDFQAGGKEIAFGAPANDDLTDVGGHDYSNEGLFKSRMHTLFEQDLNTDGDVVAGGDVINGDGLALSQLKSAIIIQSTSIPSTSVGANNSVWAYAQGWKPTAIAGYTPMAVLQATPDNQSSLIMQVTLVPETYGDRFVGSVRNISSSNLTDTFKIPVLYIRNDLI